MGSDGRIRSVSPAETAQFALATRLDPEQTALIESEVEEILAGVPRRVWDGRSLPVPVERIAREAYGLRVLLKSGEEMKEAVGCSADDPFDMSGLLLTGIGEIWINSWEAEQSWGSPRTRFTIGHELGHFVMHRTVPQGIYCRATPEDESASLAPVPRPIPEVEANTFSAALLMPGDMVRRRITDGESEECITRVQTDFSVSRKASQRRIAALESIG